MELNTVKSEWTDENVLDVVRRLRNDLIKDFLDERLLKDYLSSHFGVRDLSPVKLEFIKKELKELLISPVNVNHYEPVITQIRLTDSASISGTNETLFYKEVETIFRKYMY